MSANTHDGALARSPRGGAFAGKWLWLAIFASAAMAAYELLSWLLFPHLVAWQAQAITLALVALSWALPASYLLRPSPTSPPLLPPIGALPGEGSILRTLIDNVPDFMYVKDADSRFLVANLAVARQMGVATPEELTGKSDFDFYPHDVAAAFHEDEQSVIRSGRPLLNREENGVDRLGNIINVLTTKVPLRNTEGHLTGIVGIGRDVTELKKAEARLSNERIMLRTLIDNIPDSLYIKDADSRFLVANLAVARRVGVNTPEDLVGKNDFDLYPQDLAKVFYEDEQNVIRSGLPLVNREETGMDRQTNEIQSRLTTKVPLHDANGRVTGIAGIGRDITEAEEGGIQAAPRSGGRGRRPLGQKRIPGQHEPRNPHTHERHHRHDGTGARDPADRRNKTNTSTMVKDSADSLLTLLNDILDFSKIEAGKLDFESIRFSLRNNLDDAVNLLGFRAHQKGLELACDILAEVPDALQGDPGRLRQVIANLVGNAIKFTSKGEIVLRVATESESQDHVVLHFAVKDTGIGIPEQKREEIFEAFTQADGSTTRTYGGTGLGLTISTRLVGMMGGSLWVESELGVGSTFHFTARFALQEHSTGKAEPLTEKQSARSSCFSCG